mmetsp:Transcript_44724/g.126348  ORF Transcript_44724/g.126348 Transcript_44724/m.126348 type:complete len:220 (-) Transcript_44724:94-753(-)
MLRCRPATDRRCRQGTSSLGGGEVRVLQGRCRRGTHPARLHTRLSHPTMDHNHVLLRTRRRRPSTLRHPPPTALVSRSRRTPAPRRPCRRPASRMSWPAPLRSRQALSSHGQAARSGPMQAAPNRPHTRKKAARTVPTMVALRVLARCRSVRAPPTPPTPTPPRDLCLKMRRKSDAFTQQRHDGRWTADLWWLGQVLCLGLYVRPCPVRTAISLTYVNS